MILGQQLINQISWSIYLFGAFLIYTAIRMIVSDDGEEFDPNQSFVEYNLACWRKHHLAAVRARPPQPVVEA